MITLSSLSIALVLWAIAGLLIAILFGLIAKEMSDDSDTQG